MLVKPFKSCKPANTESKKVQKWQKVALMGSWIRGSNYLQAPRSAVESNESYAIGVLKVEIFILKFQICLQFQIRALAFGLNYKRGVLGNLLNHKEIPVHERSFVIRNLFE